MNKKQRARRSSPSQHKEGEDWEAQAGPGKAVKRMAAALVFVLGALLAAVLLLRTGGAQRPSVPQLYGYTMIKEYPHDPDAFTQGLDFDRNATLEFFWESTGMYGQSSVRQVELATGDVLRKKMLNAADFGEGLTRFGDKMYQEVWKSGKLYTYSVDNFDLVQSTMGPLTDGWGVTTDNTSLIMSDGSNTLSWVDPVTLTVQRTVTVMDGDQAAYALNELEWVDGEVWANVWNTDCIARINPTTGAVKGWILLGALHLQLRAQNIQQDTQMDVLNGIAWDPATDRIFITGKYWPRLYQIQVNLQTASPNALQLLAVRNQCIKSNSGF